MGFPVTQGDARRVALLFGWAGEVARHSADFRICSAVQWRLVIGPSGVAEKLTARYVYTRAHVSQFSPQSVARQRGVGSVTHLHFAFDFKRGKDYYLFTFTSWQFTANRGIARWF